MAMSRMASLPSAPIRWGMPARSIRWPASRYSGTSRASSCLVRLRSPSSGWTISFPSHRLTDIAPCSLPWVGIRCGPGGRTPAGVRPPGPHRIPTHGKLQGAISVRRCEGKLMVHSELGLRSRTRQELAVLVPEYLLAGHLIDRAGMPHLIGALGRDAMRDIAIDEWRGASPVYTKRMQRALGFEGDSVETIFKGLQIDIGAPPQFMDFRYRLIDHDHGEFWLDHCGALMDVEPMGPEYVVAMCHDIEDPTFDATATATNARAQVRPIHRPPRIPADRVPHCHWTVTIADDHDPLPVPPETEAMAATNAAAPALAQTDPDEDGRHDY